MTCNVVALALQATHSTLRITKIQKGRQRRPGRVDATSDDAATVNTIAVH